MGIFDLKVEQDIEKAVTHGQGYFTHFDKDTESYIPDNSYELRSSLKRRLGQGTADDGIDLALEMWRKEVDLRGNEYMQLPFDSSFEVKKQYHHALYEARNIHSMLEHYASNTRNPSMRRALVQRPEDVFRLYSTYFKSKAKIPLSQDDVQSLMQSFDSLEIEPEECTGFALL